MVSDNPKLHPSVDEGEHVLRATPKLLDFAKAQNKAVEADDNARSLWLRQEKYYLRRRLCLDDRNPQFPWPGSSNIVLPLIDMQIDKLRPAFINLVWGRDKIVAFLPQLPQSAENARNAELYFNWYLNHRMPGAFDAVALGVDRLLQHGSTIFHVGWDHRTINAHDVIVRHQLPQQLQAIMVQRGITQEIADEIFNATGGQVAPLTKKEFDRAETREAIHGAVLRAFRLNEDDEVDIAASKRIMDFLRNPERYPNDTLTVKTREVEYSGPRIWSVSHNDLIVPRGTTDIQASRRIAHDTYATMGEIRRMARENDWNENVVDELAKKRPATNPLRLAESLDVAQARDPGGLFDETMMPRDEEVFTIRRIYAYYDYDGDGLEERVLLTYVPAVHGLLKQQELPYANGKWPFVKIDFEKTSERFYASRGVPHKLDDIDLEITYQHRQKLNRMAIANCPTMKGLQNTAIPLEDWQFVPGGILPVAEMGDLEPMQWPILDVSFDREEEILRTWAEQHIGGTDFGLHNQGSLTEARTAQEIRAVEFARQQVLSVRGKAFQVGMKQIWDMVWDLMNQFPQDDIWVQTTGAEPIHFTRKDIQGNFDLIPVGAIGDNDPTFKAQQALATLQVLMQAAPLVQGDPNFALSMGEAVANYLESQDVAKARVIMRRRTPEEVQQILAEQQRKQALREQVEANMPVSPGEALEFVEEAKKLMPHGGRQRIAPMNGAGG